MVLKFTSINWTEIEDAIYAWVLNYSGLNPATDQARVIWEELNAPQPDPTYIGMKFISGPNKIATDDLRFDKRYTITFDADFVTGNLIDLKVNNISMTQVPFNTDQATTMQDLIDQIKTDFSFIVHVKLTGRKLTFIHRIDNTAVTITNVVVTGGATQPVGTVSSDEYFNLAGLRTTTLSVSIYGRESMQFMVNLQNSLERPAVIDAFREVQLAVANHPDIMDIAALQETLFEARKVMDIIFNLGSNEDISVPSETSVIEDVNINGTLNTRNVQIQVDT